MAPKSIPNQGKIEVASRMRFWSVLGWPWTPNLMISYENGSRFGDHFRPKNEKWHPKRHAKIDAEKVSKMYTKRLPK